MPGMKITDKRYRPDRDGPKNTTKPSVGVKPVKRPTTMPIKTNKPMPVKPGAKPIKRPVTRPVMTNKPKPRPTNKPIKPGMIKRGM